MIRIGKLGEGTYGSTYEVKPTKKDKVQMAVKRNIIDATVSFSGSLRELDLLNRLRGHPYIVKLLSVTFGNPFVCPNSPIGERRGKDFKEDYLHFVFEKGDQNMHQVIYEKKIHVGFLKLSMLQTLLAVEYMHAKGVIHRDIKPANLLWFVQDGKSSVKLCDFGLSKVHTRQEPSSPYVVTCWYRAPEICCKNKTYSYASDIWSLGCVFVEMISKSPLLLGMKDDNEKLVSKIIGFLPNPKEEEIRDMTKNYSIALTKDANVPGSGGGQVKRKSWREIINLKGEEIEEFNKYPGGTASYDNFLDLIDKMLQLDPKKRLTASELLCHPFFAPYLEIIKWSRDLYPAVPKSEPSVEIFDCIERRWASKLAFIIFNGQNGLSWYKHRIIFQSLDLFDRYLCYLKENQGNKELLNETHLSGKYLSRYNTHLRYMVCLYMSIKYFTTLSSPIPFGELATEDYKTPEAMVEAEEFEQKMLKEILKFKIYRETVFEAADRFDKTLDDYQVRDLLLAYGTSSSFSSTTPSFLLKTYLKL